MEIKKSIARLDNLLKKSIARLDNLLKRSIPYGIAALHALVVQWNSKGRSTTNRQQPS
ncbi:MULTISPECIES: hypothetical protein [unclassified Microcoleus]|uniref:hypothetical protein n=1 Tax=unclassified Microcoleus TaxID=2642155 RepID=UPI002FD67F63